MNYFLFCMLLIKSSECFHVYPIISVARFLKWPKKYDVYDESLTYPFPKYNQTFDL